MGSIYGVGISDPGYATRHHEWIDGKLKIVWQCPFHATWKNMMGRCYSKAYRGRCPTYTGCAVSDEWLRFSSFRNWMESQDWDGKHLDKDILFPGNKIYSPSTCVFVSREVNLFLSNCLYARGKYPVGVVRRKDCSRFQARCSNPFTGKVESVGLFLSAEDARKAWLSRKHDFACRYADLQSDSRVAAALRERFKP